MFTLKYKIKLGLKKNSKFTQPVVIIVGSEKCLVVRNSTVVKTQNLRNNVNFCLKNRF